MSLDCLVKNRLFTVCRCMAGVLLWEVVYDTYSVQVIDGIFQPYNDTSWNRLFIRDLTSHSHKVGIENEIDPV